MSEQDAIERVAGSLDEVLGDLYVDGDLLDMNDVYNVATAAIAAHTAYLRERAQDADVVEAAARRFQDMLVEWENDAMNKSVTNDLFTDSNAYELANATITAALDVLLGKEDVMTDDERDGLVDELTLERAENEAWAKLMRHSDMGRVPWANNLAKAAMEYGIEAALSAVALASRAQGRKEVRDAGGIQQNGGIEADGGVYHRNSGV